MARFKRLSNKKRKLIYIRDKNKLRKGGEIINMLKISKDMIADTEFINKHINFIVSELSKNFKMELCFSDVIFGYCDDGWIEGIASIRFKIKRL